MLVFKTDLNKLSKERSLRQDFDFHFFSQYSNGDCYVFNDLFEIIASPKINFEDLEDDFLYCEIGDVDKNGSLVAQKLNKNERSLLNENYFSKIEKGDIISVEKDQILLSKVRPNLKKYVRITESNSHIYFTSAFIKIKAKKIPVIMYYCLRKQFYSELMSISRQGKGYPTINENDLVYLKFKKPIIDALCKQQDYLNDKILCIENQIELLNSQITPTQKIIDYVLSIKFDFDYSKFNELTLISDYKSSFVDFANNPDLRFSVKFHRPAGEYVQQELNRITTKKIKHFLAEPILLGASVSPSDYNENGEYQYLSMATIKKWKFDNEAAQYVSMLYSDSKVEKTIRYGDIILARSGEGTIGKVALIEQEDIKAIFADFTMRIRLKNYNLKFAYYYMRSTYFQYLIEIYKKGLGNNTNIFPIVVREFPLPDLSLEEQQKIVDEIQAEINKQNEIKQEIQSLRNQIDEHIESVISAYDS